MYFSKSGHLSITDWEIYISPPAKRQTVFYKTQWLSQMNMLLSNQVSGLVTVTFALNFLYYFPSASVVIFYSLWCVIPFFSLHFEHILTYCSIFMHGRDARLSDKKLCSHWIFTIILIAVVVVSKDTQRFWKVLLEASVSGGLSKMSLSKLPLVVQMNLHGMLLRRWSFRQLRQVTTFPGF